MLTLTLNNIKTSLRITHNKLDDDIATEVDACMADLERVGVVYADETDPLVLNAIKLWCRAAYTDDAVKSSEYLRRYETLRACLAAAEGYGHPIEEAADE